jgi:penicillin-insensitive murein DD-endopeptidase
VCCALANEKGAALDNEESHAPTITDAPREASSSGLPWDGRLQHAARLHMNALVRAVPDYAAHGNFYGTAELVSLLERAARVIATRWPGSQLAVGELSAAKGGKLEGHHSHRSGRDADVAFFMRDEKGNASHFWRFVKFGGDGVSILGKHRYYFDDARNWAFISTLLRDRDARIQYVFVAQALRTRLLMQGRRQGESDDFLRVAAAVMVEPKEARKHDNHFHVRVYCARDDRPECQDSAPYWPWYDGAPPGGQYAELPTIRWRIPNVARADSAQAQRF